MSEQKNVPQGVKGLDYDDDDDDDSLCVTCI
jgi:hypothetical protein